jgi:hypothetical protein
MECFFICAINTYCQCASALQDKLLDYRMKAPCVPEVKDPDYCDENEMDEEVEGFASDFL